MGNIFWSEGVLDRFESTCLAVEVAEIRKGIDLGLYVAAAGIIGRPVSVFASIHR
jgi:hypothetical protein